MNYRKFIHPLIGYEVVLDADNNIITDPVNAGTYNFYNPSGKSNLLGSLFRHNKFDVDPYVPFGNALDDKSTPAQRKNRYDYINNAVFWSSK